MSAVGTAVILAGGLGTRMLPASKAIPKEMLPLADRPILQYAVEEAAASRVDHVVIVISEGKETVREHFTEPAPTTETLRAQGRTEFAETSAAPSQLATVEFAYQLEPKGIAHALQQAQPLVRGEAMAVVYPDDVIFGKAPVIGQLAAAYERRPGTILAVEDVPDSEVSSYGIVDPAGEGDPIPVRAVVEKPSPEEAPSRLGIVGRLIVPVSIFEHIAQLTPGKGGELQLTDAVARQLSAGEPVSAVRFTGARYDTGRPPGYIAANVAAAMQRPDLADSTRALVQQALEQD